MSMTADVSPDRAPITISMDGDLVVIAPCDQLDHESTDILVGALNAATEAGSVALIDLDGDGTSPAPFPHRDTPAGASGERAVVAATGCVRLPSASSFWLLDLGRRRLCRSADPVDRRFVCADGWISIRKLWMSATDIAVLTADDSFISTTIAAARP